MNDRQKKQRVRQMKTETLQTIIDNLKTMDDEEARPEYPLVGMVHLSGIGQVRVKWLRDELSKR